MMSTSFSQSALSSTAIPIAVLEYREVGFDLPTAAAPLEEAGVTTAEDSAVRLSLTEEDLQARLRQAAADAREKAERELRQEFATQMEGESVSPNR